MSETLKNLKPMPQSKIIFFKNGEAQGEAFVDVYHGAYYPAFSIYRNATVSVNFGPNFKYPEIEETFSCKGVRFVFCSLSLQKKSNKLKFISHV